MTKAREALNQLIEALDGDLPFTHDDMFNLMSHHETLKKALEMLDKVESGKAFYGEWLHIESAPKETLIFIKAKGCDSGP